MKVKLKKEERDYSMSGGLFNSSQIQDVMIYSEDLENYLAWLVVEQPYYYSNSWGTHRINGGVQIKIINKTFKEYMDESYGGLTFDIVNRLFKPKRFTREGEFEEVEI